MDKKIFPASILEQSADQIFNEGFHFSGVLYLTALLAVVGCLVMMNFIHIDVTVHATGMIKPKEDHTVIATTVSGFVRSYNLTPNLHVDEGDTLLVIRSEIITSKLPMLEKRNGELEELIADLKKLTKRKTYGIKLKSPVYKQDVLYYLSQWNEADAKRKQAKSAYERSRKLLDANVIPLSEFEPVELEYIQAENAVRTLDDSQKRKWASELLQYENEHRDIETQIEQIAIQDAETVICSPVAGTIQHVQTLFDGSFVTAGQQILEISPDGDLIAECYVHPKDIGYISPGMMGRVQVSAFNYTEWGVLNARVDEVFEDVSVSADGQQSYYRVFCTLDSDHLTLKNGFEGYIKKGMAVNTNFIVTSRTVFQLLYDKIDNWLNPEIQKDRDE